MDANGQRFWMWSQPADWLELDGTAVALSSNTVAGAHDAAPRPLLALRAERAAPALRDGPARELLAETELARLPLLRDRFGTLARWDVPSQTLMGFGAFEGEVPRYATTAGSTPLALALDHDDVLLLAFADRIEMVDLRDRFAPLRLTPPLLGGTTPFTPHALACDAVGGRWALDRNRRRLARIAGTPWPDRAGVVYDPGTFRPSPENPDAPHIELLPVALPAELRPVAMAASPAGRLAVACWGADGELVLLASGADGAAPQRLVLAGAAYAHAIAWLDDSEVALRIADLDEALAYVVPPGLAADMPLQPVGRRYPSADAAAGPFVAAQSWPPHLPLAQPVEPALGGPDTTQRFSRELVPLAWRGFVAEGSAAGRAIDSGQLDLNWHRLYLEAIIPAGCGVLVELAASDENLVPADDVWWPHWFGDLGAAPALPAGTPHGVWQSEGSELPHRAGLLDCPPQAGRVGLFNVLVQRAGRRLRALRGRHLWQRITLFGNGRSTPEVAALRLWGERFSYVRRYLPELYRDEEVFDRDVDGEATPHDYLERFSQLFEGLLTPWEDGIAETRVLCDPSSTPPQTLPWLAGWTGESFPARLDAKRRRDWLVNAVALRRHRGTLHGLQLALDIASGGQVSRGRVIVIEDFRLRRTMATLLGIDLNRGDDDSLLPGLVVSGNSFVGDTLILGDADDAQARREFLALFGDAIESEAEAETVASVYQRTAHRATVLVHEDLDDDLRALVANIASEMAPAHVLIKVIAAREPFLVGVASLVGVDSYLRDPLQPATARIDVSDIGRGDHIRGGGAFDWRLEDGVPSDSFGEPTAVLEAPGLVEANQPLTLDGRHSVPPSGGQIVRWRFTRKN
ncbi:phage tail protein [Piscinibacter sakaiensis]|uniref:phage tail protein n=1 Tax=Piscinibacter sakaiensis TaxID=1547922 RepID=UPI003AAE449E